MKKIIFNIAILVSIFSLVLISCNKDDDDDPQEEATASYEFVIDGSTISSNSSAEFGFLQNADESTAAFSAGESGNTFGMQIFSPPSTTGNSVPMDADATILITGTSIAAYTDFGVITIETGTITRTADDKVSFTGTFDHNTTTHTASGFIKSSGMVGR